MKLSYYVPNDTVHVRLLQTNWERKNDLLSENKSTFEKNILLQNDSSNYITIEIGNNAGSRFIYSIKEPYFN